MVGNDGPTEMFKRRHFYSHEDKLRYITDSSMTQLLLSTISINGSFMHLYSVERKTHSIFKGNYGTFSDLRLDGMAENTNLLCYTSSSIYDRAKYDGKERLNVREVGHSDNPLPKMYGTYNKMIHKEYAQRPGKLKGKKHILKDVVRGIETSDRHGIVFLLTAHGYVRLYDIETNQHLCKTKIGDENDTFFMTSVCEETGSLRGLSTEGNVYSVSINDENFTRYVLDINRDIPLSKRLVTAITKREDGCGKLLAPRQPRIINYVRTYHTSPPRPVLGGFTRCWPGSVGLGRARLGVIGLGGILSGLVGLGRSFSSSSSITTASAK